MSYEHEPGDYFESCCSFFTAANVVVQMWSTRYITSFYPYTEIFQSFVWQHKTVIVVFLDPIEEILRALETMPQFEIIYEKIFMLRGCFLKIGHVQWGKFYGISSVGRTFDETKSDLVYLLQSEDIISGGRCEVIHTPIRADGLTAGFDIFLSYCWRNSSSAATAGDISNYIGLTDPRDLKRDIERETHLRCWLDIEQLGCDGLFEGLHRALSNTSLSLVVLCLSDEYAASPNCAMELQYAIRRIPCIVVCVGDGEGWRKTPTGLFSAFQESFDLCKNPYPQSEQGQAIFNRLVMRIRAICRLKQGVSHAVALR